MLKDIVDYIVSRTDKSQEDAKREINYAFKELWKSVDLPNSIFEVTVKPANNTAIISLPWYVDQIKGVKQNTWGVERIILNTPRAYYQNNSYYQHLYTWRVLGTSPLCRSITNASTLTLSFKQPVTTQVTVSIIGQTDQGSEFREQLLFAIGDVSKETAGRYSDLSNVTKSIITENDLFIYGPNSEELGIIPNRLMESKYKIIQLYDKYFIPCNNCNCYDILYKLPPPILYFDEDPVPEEEIVMTKTMEWINLSKQGQEKMAAMYGEKARNLLFASNNNADHPVDHPLDIAPNRLIRSYSGYL